MILENQDGGHLDIADILKGDMNMSTSMSQKKKVDMINKVKSTIILCRNNKVLREFAN